MLAADAGNTDSDDRDSPKERKKHTSNRVLWWYEHKMSRPAQLCRHGPRSGGLSGDFMAEGVAGKLASIGTAALSAQMCGGEMITDDAAAGSGGDVKQYTDVSVILDAQCLLRFNER